MKKLILLVALIYLTANAQTPGNGVTIDGTTYNTVIIGNQEWMTENLKSTLGLVSIPVSDAGNYFGTLNINFAPLCFIKNGIYFYNFYAAEQFINTTSSEWHLPSGAEFESLNSSVSQLYQLAIPGFGTCTSLSTNSYSFSISPTGFVEYYANISTPYKYYGFGYSQQFWTTTFLNQYFCGDDYDDFGNVIPNVFKYQSFTPSTFNNDQKYGRSIRLVKDAPLSTNTFNKNNVSIYPNPVKNELNIQTDEIIKSIEIFDILGNCVHKEKNKKQNINIEHLSKGIYLIRIQTEKRIINQKIIKE